MLGLWAVVCVPAAARVLGERPRAGPRRPHV